jgi:iron complex outermembrane recepter protein
MAETQIKKGKRMKQHAQSSVGRERRPHRQSGVKARSHWPLRTGTIAVMSAVSLMAAGLAQGADERSASELQAENLRLRQEIEALKKTQQQPVAGGAATARANEGARIDAGVPAPAAAVADDRVETLDQFVVRARSREEKLQDVPIPVSVISGKSLERNSASTIQDFAKLAPNLMVHAPNARQQNISIRGVGRNLFNDALEPSVAVIVDGVVGGHISQAWGDFGDLDHVEVLRGPQGTLMGKNATLGVVNVVSNAPSFKRESNVEVSFGSDKAVGARAVIGGPIQDGVLAYRATVFSERRLGPYSNTAANETSQGVQEKNRIGGKIQFLLLPSEDVSVRLIADRQQSNELLLWAEPALFGDPATFPNGVSRTLARSSNGTVVNALTYSSRLERPYFNGFKPNLGNWDSVERDAAQPTTTIRNGLSAQVDWKVNDFKFTSITAYRDSLFDAKNDYDSSHFDVQRGGGYVKHKQVSQELRLNSSIGKDIDYTAGLYFLNSEIDSPDRGLFGVDAGAFYATTPQYNTLSQTLVGKQLLQDSLRFRYGVNRSQPDTRSLGAFGQANWHLDEKTTLTLGLRQTHEKRTNQFSRFAQDSLLTTNGDAYYTSRGATAAELSAAKGILNVQAGAKGPAFQTYDIPGAEINATSYSWLINPSYKLSDNVLLYASLGKGEKSGASLLDATGTNGLTAPVGFAIKPEKVLDFELGAKTTLLDKKLVVNTNVYNTRINDYHQTLSAVDTVATAATGVTSFYNYVGNIPGVTLRGLEVDGSYAATNRLLFSFGGAYNRAYYSDFKNSPCPTEVSGQLDPVTGKTNPASQICDYTGKQLPFAPRLSGVLGVDYRLPLNATYSLHLFGNAVYRSKANYAANLSSYGQQSGYALYDGGIGVQTNDGKWEFAFVGKNLTDEHFVTAVTPFSSTNGVTGASGERRYLGVVLRGKL